MRSRAPAGITTQTLSREEDATAAGSSRYRCERRPGALAAWENNKRKWYTSLEDTQALMTTKFPFIVLAWCVRRQCPAPTPERARILMAVGNSKVVHVFARPSSSVPASTARTSRLLPSSPSRPSRPVGFHKLAFVGVGVVEVVLMPRCIAKH